jgi:energy-converting hydrogenase Eha subunit E
MSSESVRFTPLTNELSFYKISPRQKRAIENEVRSWAICFTFLVGIFTLVMAFVAINSLESYHLMRTVVNQTQILADEIRKENKN